MSNEPFKSLYFGIHVDGSNVLMMYVSTTHSMTHFYCDCATYYVIQQYSDL